MTPKSMVLHGIAVAHPFPAVATSCTTLGISL